MTHECAKCGSKTVMQVQAVVSAPGDLSHSLSKTNLRRKDVRLMGVNWETANYICVNPKCGFVLDGFGNYVTRLKDEVELLKAEIAKLKSEKC